MFIFVFSPNTRLFSFSRIFLYTSIDLVFQHFFFIASSIALTPVSKAPLQLTFLHSLRIRNLNALAYLGKKYYLCVEMAGKGSDSRMSDECLMKGKSGLLFFGEYQADMRKFTLAGKSSIVASGLNSSSKCRTFLPYSRFRKSSPLNSFVLSATRRYVRPLVVRIIWS